MVTNRRLTCYAPAKEIGFVGTVSFHQNDDGKNFTIDDDFAFITKGGLRLSVCRGFISDLASTPRVIWWLLPPFGKYTDAAIVHDFLYRRHGRALGLTRLQCDNILLEAMRDLGVSRWQQALIYRGVRLGGWVSWRQDNA